MKSRGSRKGGREGGRRGVFMERESGEDEKERKQKRDCTPVRKKKEKGENTSKRQTKPLWFPLCGAVPGIVSLFSLHYEILSLSKRGRGGKEHRACLWASLRSQATLLPYWPSMESSVIMLASACIQRATRHPHLYLSSTHPRPRLVNRGTPGCVWARQGLGVHASRLLGPS